MTQAAGAVRLRGRGALARLAGRKRARAFAARADVQTIEHAEVRIADDFEAPKQGQTQRAADTAGGFHDELATSERLHLNLGLDSFFAGFHRYQQ